MKEKINLIPENTSQYVVEKSKFISYSFYFDDKSKLQDIIKKIKREHLSATHIVYAYRYFEGVDINGYINNNLDMYCQSYFDDGEPSGTAGAPVLRAIEDADISNVLIVVVRYFGGIKLGAAGLVKAYKKSAQEVIYDTKTLSLYDVYEIDSSYPDLNYIFNYCEKKGIIVSRDFGETAKIIFGTQDAEDLKRIVNNKYKLEFLGRKYL